MALAVGSFVTPHRVSDGYTAGYHPQPMRIGIVDKDAGGNTWEVLWDDGYRETAIPGMVLDEIADALSYDHVCKVVELDLNATVSLQPSPSYDSVVLSRFRRNQNGAGTYTADRLMCKLLNADVYYEADASDATVLDNR